MIKAVRINPAKIVTGGSSTDITVPIFIEVDAETLYKEIVNLGIDPSTVQVGHVVQRAPGEYDTAYIDLEYAVNNDQTVSVYYEVFIN